MIGLYVHARGASPLQAGLEIPPLTIFIPVSNTVFARVSGRIATGPLPAVSFLVAGATSLALVAPSPSTPYWMLDRLAPHPPARTPPGHRRGAALPHREAFRLGRSRGHLGLPTARAAPASASPAT